MPSRPDPWHFPRPELARQYLEFFETNVSNALVLFQRRRFGKTEFCLHDLAPEAEARGYTVAYVSFWQSRLSPAAALIHSIEKSLDKRPLVERLRHLLTAPVTKLTLSGELGGAKAGAEVELANIPRRPPSDLLIYLGDLIERAAKKARSKYLLILDEAQELAENAANDSLVAALRTILDTNKQTVRVVFTGSSQEGLQRMFSSRKAPFFHFGTQIDLPQLGEAFVGHIGKAFNAASRRAIDPQALVKTYTALGQNPFYLRKLAEVMLVRPDLTIQNALSELRAKLAVEQGYPRIWESLKPLDRALLSWLAAGNTQAFTQEARRYLATRAGLPEVSIQVAQTAIRRLTKAQLVRGLPERGSYSPEDSEFSEWARGHS